MTAADQRHVVWAIVRNEVRILRREVDAIVLLIVMPLVLIPALKGPVEAGFEMAGSSVDGVQFVVAGQTVMFGFFTVTYIGFGVFREHGWHTWDRLLAGPVTPARVVVGKTLPWMVVGVAQTVILFGLGMLLWDFSIPARAVAGIAALTVCYALLLAGFSMLLIALTDSIMMLQSVANLAAIVLATLGGAMVPFTQLPGWMQNVSPVTPTYWMMRGYNALLIDGESSTAVVLPCAIVLVFAIVCALIGVRTFDPEEEKEFAE